MSNLALSFGPTEDAETDTAFVRTALEPSAATTATEYPVPQTRPVKNCRTLRLAGKRLHVIPASRIVHHQRKDACNDEQCSSKALPRIFFQPIFGSWMR